MERAILGPADSRVQKALAERIASGDRSAEEEFVRLFQPRVFVFLCARTHDREAARDLTQETLMAALGALREGRVRDVDEVAAYVHGVMRNMVGRYYRNRLQSREVPLPEDFELAEPEPDPDDSGRMRALDGAVNRLSAEDRRLLLMVLVDGLKPGEIAARLGLDPDVVRQRKCRAVKKVMDAMKRMSRKA
jgi:RNA polymerase sigma factor (sigma-70 family)